MTKTVFEFQNFGFCDHRACFLYLHDLGSNNPKRVDLKFERFYIFFFLKKGAGLQQIWKMNRFYIDNKARFREGLVKDVDPLLYLIHFAPDFT